MPVSDIRVYAGPADGWVSLRGPEGPAGPTVVSADAGNVAKLGTDNRILVAQSDLDARYVNVAGDTMTGTLSVRAPTGSPSYIQTLGDGNSCAQTFDAYGTASAPFLSFKKFRGTVAAPTAALTGDSLCTIQVVTANAAGTQIVAGQIRTLVAADPVTGQAGVKTRMEFAVNSGLSSVTPFQITDAGVTVSSTGSDATVSRMAATAIVSGASKTAIGIGVDVTGGTVQNVGLQIGTMTGAVNPYGIVSFTTANSLFAGGMSLGAFTTLTGNRKLDVTGDAVVRGILETTGNITSTGTAHNFQPNSILASAISGLPVAASTAPLDLSVVAGTGNLTTYARADHQHKLPTYAALGPLPVASIGNAGAVKVGAGINLAVDGTISVATSSLKADDLTDVTITTPAAGQVLRWNGTAFVNAALSYADLTGAPAAPVASTVAGTALAATAAVGVSTAYARADHVHPLPTAAQVGAISQADADTRYVNITGDTVTGDLILNGKVGVGVTPTSGFHVKTSTIILDGGTSTNTIVANAPSAFGGVGVIDSQSIVSANATAATGSYTAVFARTRGTDLNPAVPRVGDFAFRSEGPAPSQLGGALSVAGNITSTGTAHSFANASIPYAAVASPGPLCNFYQASRTITAADVGRMIVNNSTGSAAVVFTLPDDTVLPVGVKLEIYDANTLGSTTIAVEAGVSMAWNTGLSGGTAGGLNTGVGPRSINMASPISRITALKVAPNFWMLFSSN